MSAFLLAAAAGGLACWAGLAAAALGMDSLLRFCLAAYVLAWAGLVAATVVLSIPGWLSRWSLAASIAALVAVGLAVWLHRGRPPPPRLDLRWREALRDPVVGALALAVLLAGLYLGALAVLTTPNDWDGLTYHETRALLWDEQGGIGYVPSGNDPRLNGNPPVSEIGLYLALMLPRSERFAALPQYIALWASLLAVVLLARRLGLSRPAAAYGGLVFATLPIVFLHGASILNDLLVASFLLVAVVFLIGRGKTELLLGKTELLLGSLSLGLALSTKFNAVLALPLLLGVVLASVRRDRRGPSALACGVGVLLGSPWYVLNLVETGAVDGDLGETTGQAADHSFRTIVGSLRALTFDVVDTSGLWRAEMYVAVAAGFALITVGAILRTRGGASARVLLYAGCLAAMTPLVLRSLARPTRYLWEHSWFKIGLEDIATDHGDAWTVLSVPDTSLSWYGAGGAVVIAGGVVVAIVGVRRRELQPVALLFALAPWILVATFALTIIYDAWRGRLLIFGVGLACAAWGWTLRVRWLSGGIAALCITTLSLSLVHSFTKPSGLRLLEPPISRSVWGRDRIDTLTVIRNFDGTPALLREIESKVPRNAEIAVATPIDTFVAPFAGPHLSRTLHLVADGDRVPSEATWIVLRGPAEALGCQKSWTTVFTEDSYDWRLLRRTDPDACGEDAATL